MPPEQQPIQQPQPQPQPAIQQELDMSDEAVMDRALNPPQRDDKGRFVAQTPAQVAEPSPEPAKPEVKEPEKPTEPPAQEDEYKWDDVKGIKLKIPMKNGDKEWEDEITLEELRNQRMMHSDYMARRKEIDTERASFETKTREKVEHERSAYLSTLQTLQQSIVQAASPELANVDWNKLAQENPAEYVRLSNRAREVNEALTKVRFEQEKVQNQQAKERDERLAKAVSESQAKLRESIPNWNDDLYQSLLKRGTDTYGFKADEVGQVWDHRVMQVLHDAHQFRLLKEQKPTADKKVEQVPTVLKPGAKPQKANPKLQEFEKMKDRLRSNGNDQDAAASVMEAFLTPR